MIQIILHIIFGISSFTLCLMTVLLGTKNAGRFGESKITKTTFNIHRILAIITGIIVIISFSLGFVLGNGLNIALTFEGGGIHGLTGLLAVILVLLQIIPSLIIKSRKKIKLIHRIVGYSLLIDLTVQLTTGILRYVTFYI
ncbi:hypothetical protein LCGC14_1107870 [marine sediment metagenome]|uniref:Cytochrome b561 domain-containing protein n=1 Tax=marine sediment metagenome TaxID=412755 RepID=A0A0F9PQT4_9ZZZZ